MAGEATSQPLNHSIIQPLNPPPLYGLIGYPLGHSFSPAYFQEKFAREGIDATYHAFPLEQITELPALIAAYPLLRGLNVTTPYKQAVLPFLDDQTSDAEMIGAVNCISVREGQLTGYNTDWLGFTNSLQNLLQPHHTRALILGNGGASLAVRYALRKLGIAFHTVSATSGKADFLYRDIDEGILGEHTILINTTILGTGGDGCPALPYNALTSAHLVYDLVYNPPLTPFLNEAQQRGATIQNGQHMLELQADESWKLWQEEY